MTHEIQNIIDTITRETVVRNGKFHGYQISVAQVATIERALSRLELLEPSSSKIHFETPVAYSTNALEIELLEIEIEKLRSQLLLSEKSQKPALNEKLQSLVSQVHKLRRKDRNVRFDEQGDSSAPAHPAN
jgi:hypothetical protein